MAKQSLNYQLPGHVQTAMRGASVPGSISSSGVSAGGWDAVEKANKSIEKDVKELDKFVAEQDKQREKEQKEIDALAAKFDVGFEKLGNRGSWATGELYDAFAEHEKGFRDDYIAALNAGETEKAQSMLREQEARLVASTNWQDTYKTAQDMYDNDLYHSGMSKEDKYILGALTAQDNPEIIMSNGEMTFRVPTYKASQAIDAQKEQLLAERSQVELQLGQRFDKGEITQEEYNSAMSEFDNNMKSKINDMYAGAEKQNVELRQFQNIVTNGIKPTEVTKQFKTETSAHAKYISEGGEWDDDYNNQAIATNKNKVTKTNIRGLLYDDFMGRNTNFKTEFKEHPDMQLANYSNIKGLDSTILEKIQQADQSGDKDGNLDSSEIANFSDADMDLIIESLADPANFNLAQEYLGEYMTLVQKKSAEKFTPSGDDDDDDDDDDDFNYNNMNFGNDDDDDDDDDGDGGDDGEYEYPVVTYPEHIQPLQEIWNVRSQNTPRKVNKFLKENNLIPPDYKIEYSNASKQFKITDPDGGVARFKTKQRMTPQTQALKNLENMLEFLGHTFSN
tara:strand:- start:751 stop:2439 length:1689 start_codon:yes stop_codon:yes gene_type:complete